MGKTAFERCVCVLCVRYTMKRKGCSTKVNITLNYLAETPVLSSVFEEVGEEGRDESFSVPDKPSADASMETSQYSKDQASSAPRSKVTLLSFTPSMVKVDTPEKSTEAGIAQGERAQAPEAAFKSHGLAKII